MSVLNRHLPRAHPDDQVAVGHLAAFLARDTSRPFNISERLESICEAVLREAEAGRVRQEEAAAAAAAKKKEEEAAAAVEAKVQQLLQQQQEHQQQQEVLEAVASRQEKAAREAKLLWYEALDEQSKGLKSKWTLSSTC